ncbi:MAG: hypothetical protein MH472_02500 [Bacteroidia bacterium]|nr:hypothetical protein [Bacteroidia bacterium]
MNLVLTKIKSNKTLFRYLSSTLITLPISIFVGYFSLRLIDPKLMGLWTGLLIIESYTLFLRLGVVNGLNRELPFELGAGNNDKALKIVSTTYGFTLINILILAIIIFPIVLFFFELSFINIVCLIVVFLKIISGFYSTYLSSTFRSNNHFDNLSNIQFVNSGIKLISSPIILLGFYGYLLFEIIQIISNTLLLHYYRPYKILPRFSKTILLDLMKTGIPLFSVSYIMNIVDTFPRLFILKAGNSELLGIYAPIIMVLGFLAIIPNNLSTYMYPKYTFKIGENNNAIAIWKHMIKLYLVSFLLICLVSIVIWFTLDFFIDFFPKYKSSLPYMKLAVILFPFCFFKLGNMINSILKNVKGMFLFSSIYAFIQLTSLWFLNNLIGDIIYVAIYSQFISWVFMIIFGVSYNFWQVKNYVKVY